MFLLCDHNEKGFVVKMDLARIDGMIPNISQQQLELFFDNADIFKTNYVTENQFIENISKFILFTVLPDEVIKMLSIMLLFWVFINFDFFISLIVTI